MTNVQLSDLDLATTADDLDLALIRKSDTTDYKVLVSTLRNLNLAAMPSLPTAAKAIDLMLIARDGTNCKMFFGSAGFIVGTKMWFFQSGSPNGASPQFWKIVPGTGDALLACRGAGSTYLNPGTTEGNWQQTNHTLTAKQIPAHFHSISVSLNSANENAKVGYARAGNKDRAAGVSAKTETDGGSGEGHNHGKTWRPLANVGNICEKML